MEDLVASLGVVGLVVFALGAFLAVTFPLVMLANKAIGAPFEREAERMKAALSASQLGYSEDGVRLRSTGVAPFAFGVSWMWADVRVDGHALYLMRYHLVFGRLRIGQPNFRMTWLKEAGVGGFTGVALLGRPELDGDSVLVRTELGLTALALRLRAKDPRRLLQAIESMS